MTAFSITRGKSGYITPYGIVSPDALQEMRNWVADCEWNDGDETNFAQRLSAETIIRGVHRHYCGGIEGFLTSL